MEKLYTIKQVCDEFGISRSTVYREHKAGKLPFVKFGRASRIRQSDALKWIADLPIKGDRS